MPGRVRFVILLHSHQPVGNFDWVIEQVFEQSYARYPEVFEQFPEIPLCLHNSGCLLEWLAEHKPDYLARLAALAQGRGASGRPVPKWEMIRGGIQEPILTMLPARDRLGQALEMRRFMEARLGVRPRGYWLPERVWEPALVSDLGRAGVEYLTLDDNHFKAAGLSEEELAGGFVTEDQGFRLLLFPALEKLRYYIPFRQVGEVLAFLKSLVPQTGERVVCYADDGEKFGSWPETHQHVYTNGWLKSFLSALHEAQQEGWLRCCTLAEAVAAVPPAGRIYLPENSYREMGEWSLPARRLAVFEKAMEELKADAGLNADRRLAAILPLVKGGTWRNFRVKYPEAGRMYGKMLEVSEKVAALKPGGEAAEKARRHLYRGQCNCAYWHGVFGGLYLPHLRSAIYTELIRADRWCDEAAGSVPARVEADFDCDGRNEVKLANSHLAVYLHPSRGGRLYEFDLREPAFNVGDTFSRHYEAYHEKVTEAVVGASEKVETIHGRPKAKEAGLEKLLRYDAYLRESLVDHLSAGKLTAEDFISGNPESDPGFRDGEYRLTPVRGGAARRGRRAGKAEAELARRAPWGGGELEVRKAVRLAGSALAADYRLKNMGAVPLEGYFAVEMNYNLLAGDAPDRYYFLPGREPAARLGAVAEFEGEREVGLKDLYLKVRLVLRASQAARVLLSPVRTVSMSEGGFESVYQSSSVVMQWPLRLPPGGEWVVELKQEVGGAGSA